MKFWALLLLLPLVAQAVTVSESSSSYSAVIAEDGTISHVFDVRYFSPEPIGWLALRYYVPAKAYNVNWQGDRGTITESSMTPYNEYFSLWSLRTDFNGVASEYALRISYDTPPDLHEYGRVVQATVCPFEANMTARITLPAGSEFLSSEPHADFTGYPPSAELYVRNCIRLTYLGETGGEGYSMSAMGEHYLLLHESQGNFSGEIENATAFIPRIESELGLPFPFAHMAYVILPNQSTEIQPWASGVYHSPGIVILRPNATTSYGLEEAAVHETAHAFNSQVPQALGADNWFDEGTADYIGHLAVLESGRWEGPLFSNRPSDKVRVSDLIYYYENNYTFMREWDPTNESFDEWRDFGYAYSQLVVRVYVDEHGPGALRATYACLAANGNDARPVPEFNNLVLGCMSNASGGADPEEILNPGRSMLSNEAEFTAYIGRIGSRYFPGEEPTPTPTPTATNTPSPAACDRHQISCENCTYYEGCGWSRAQVKCLSGSEGGSDDGSSYGNDWAWRARECAGTAPDETVQPLACCPASLIILAAPLLAAFAVGRKRPAV